MCGLPPDTVLGSTASDTERECREGKHGKAVGMAVVWISDVEAFISRASTETAHGICKPCSECPWAAQPSLELAMVAYLFVYPCGTYRRLILNLHLGLRVRNNIDSMSQTPGEQVIE